MIAPTLLRLLAARRAPFLAVSGLLLGLFQFLICAAVTSADVGAALQALMSSLPAFLQDLVSAQLFGGLSERGLLAFGWNHPIAHALGTAAAIVLASRAVAGESENGALELLLSQPLSRATYFATQVGFALAALACVTLAGILGTVAGQTAYRMEPFAARQLLGLGANYFALQVAWFGVALALSAFEREAGRVAGIAFLVALLSYIAQVIGRVWKAAAFVLPWSLHDYFSPQDLLAGSASLLRPLLTLAGVALAAILLAAWRFERRDLP